MNEPGKGKAIASLVLGIIGCLMCFGFSTVILPILGMIVGIIGLALASSSKKEGFAGGIRTAGFILSILAVIFGGIMFTCVVTCVGSCAACVACGGAESGAQSLKELVQGADIF